MFFLHFSAEKVNLKILARKFETPFYCYSYKKLKKNINYFKSNFKSISPLICFALKSNSNLQLVKEVKKLGLRDLLDSEFAGRGIE